MSTFEYVEYSVSGRIANIFLDDGKMNTMSEASVADWMNAIKRANVDDNVGAIVVAGRGRVFCAGADMDNLFLPKMTGAVPYEENDPYLGGLGLLKEDWIALLQGSKPIVVAFNGAAIGGGATAFLCADVLIASEKALFSFPFTKLGIVPEMCSTRFLPARVGVGRAANILLSGRTVAAAEALEIGLIDYLYSADSLLEEAKKLAASMAESSSKISMMTKRLLAENALETTTEKVWRRESDALRSCFAMPEHKQAVEAFLSKGNKKK